MGISKRTVRRIVRKEIRKEQETKCHAVEVSRRQGNLRHLHSLNLAQITQGVNSFQRVGNDIRISGVRIRVTWENDAIAKPILVRYVMCLIHGEQTNSAASWEMFRTRDDQIGQNFNQALELGAEGDKNIMWNPYNKERLFILDSGYETINRSSTTSNHDSRQSICHYDKFVKVNREFQYDNNNTGLKNQNLRMGFYWWATDLGLNTSLNENKLSYTVSAQVYFQDS